MFYLCKTLSDLLIVTEYSAFKSLCHEGVCLYIPTNNTRNSVKTTNTRNLLILTCALHIIAGQRGSVDLREEGLKKIKPPSLTSLAR